MYAADLTINGAQTLQNALDDVEVGSTLSYQLCKELYLKHPLGAKLVDLPIDKGLMTKREILIQDAPTEVIEQFEKTWKTLKANRAIEMAVRNSRIYGTGSIAIVFKDPEIKPSANMRWELCQNQQFAFNALDPLNTAGTGVLTQNPTDYDFQEIHGVMVSGVNYHHSRTFQVVNECPVYLSWTASAFGYTGRSVYTRAIYPLKSFISTMIADDMVAQKVGVMIQKTEKSGSVIDGLMQKIGAIKRSFLKIASTGNVLEVGLKDSIETLNMTGIDSALNAVRKNILENIASSDKMPALLMLSETFATGFGEGSEDAKQISAYLDNFREKHAALYDWMDKVVRKTAWTPEFYATIQARYPAEYGNKPYFVAIKQWHDNFSYEWESLIKEPESEAVNVESVKFKAVTDLMGIVFDKLDPANQSAFLKFCESNLNESTKLFPNKLELDFDAYEQHQAEQQEQQEPPQFGQQEAFSDSNDDKWITINGAKALIGKDGNIKGGLGGKFTGQKKTEIGEKPQKRVSATYKEQKEAITSVFDDTMDFNDQAMEMMGNPLTKEYKLSAPEAVALKLYSSSFYANINNALRNNETDENGLNAKKAAEVVSDALAKLPNYEGKVFRQTRMTQEQLSKYKTGDIITEAGFTSTSMIKGGANFSDLPVSIEIINSKSGKDISGFSDEKDEQEVLFDKGAKFKVISKKDNNGKTIIYLEEV